MLTLLNGVAGLLNTRSLDCLRVLTVSLKGSRDFKMINLKEGNKVKDTKNHSKITLFFFLFFP
jgi:hypothetical protein